MRLEGRPPKVCLPVVFVRGANSVRILPPGEASPVLAAARASKTIAVSRASDLALAVTPRGAESKRVGERKGNCSTNGDHDRAIPLAAFQVIMYGRIAGDHRGMSGRSSASRTQAIWFSSGRIGAGSGALSSLRSLPRPARPSDPRRCRAPAGPACERATPRRAIS